MLTQNIGTIFAMVSYRQEQALAEARRNQLLKKARVGRKRERRGFRLPWRAPRINETPAGEFACAWNPVAC